MELTVGEGLIWAGSIILVGLLSSIGKNAFNAIGRNATKDYVDEKIRELKTDHEEVKKRFFSTRDRVREIDLEITKMIPKQFEEVKEKLDILINKIEK